MKIIHRGREVGDKGEAGKICGITGTTYSYYTRRETNPAPGPIDYRAPGSNAMLYDLDKVREWHENRPGLGWRSGETGPPSKRKRRTRAPRRVSVPLSADHIRALLAAIEVREIHLKGGELIDATEEDLPGSESGVIAAIEKEWVTLDQARSVLGVGLRQVDGS